MKSRKSVMSSNKDLLILGTVLTGIYFVSQAVTGYRMQRSSLENQVVATYDPSSNELVDSATGREYAVVQETERNPWDNLDYEVRTGKLVLEETRNGGGE